MNKYVVQESYTIKEVMDRFEKNKERVAVVLNQKSKVIGVVSQGDIIRALTAGISIYAKVSQIIQASFLYVHDMDYEIIYKLFKQKNITLLPVVDIDFNLVQVVTIHDIFIYLEESRN